VPLPLAQLGYVLVYAFETSAGVYLVDCGWECELSWAGLVSGLAATGHAISDIRGVLGTHVHPDHYGLAGRIRAEAGAWLALHPLDAKLVCAWYGAGRRPHLVDREVLRDAGVPDSDLVALEADDTPPFGPAAPPDRLVHDGQRVDIPGWQVIAVWTPGHSPGHLCYHVPEQRILLSGDHILPRITSGIPYSPRPGDDALGDFLESVTRLHDYDVGLVLPAHETRFDNLPLRVAQLCGHHDRRLTEVIAAVTSGAATAWEIAAAITWALPWEAIHGAMRRGAVTETLAHLRALQRRGVLTRADGPPIRWSLAHNT
jgi:glyoxylase-like metal-dependent hydrolase (beta-lactamase superfamily II)